MRLTTLVAFFFLISSSVYAAAPGDLNDCSGSPQSIGTGGVDQTQLSANGFQTNLWIENYCTSTTQNIVAAESLWVNFGAAAAVGTGFELAPCGSMVFTFSKPEQQSVHVFATTTGHQFACKANR